MDEIQKKETGPFHHMLDSVWRYLPFGTAGAASVSAAALGIYGGVGLYTLPVSMLAVQVAAGAHGLRNWRLAERRKRLYDTAPCQAYLRDLEAQARGIVASQRGTVWVVTEPRHPEPTSRVKIFNEREYQHYRTHEVAAGTPLDEVRINSRSVARTVVREGREFVPQEIDFGDIASSAPGRIERWLRNGQMTSPQGQQAK
ncbi:hypothetical protein [Xanthobacter sediminis]